MNPLSMIRNFTAHMGRISVIARHAFTQLVRMKVFYFLAFFALILIGSNFFNLPQHEGPEAAGVNILRSIKSWSLGAMTLFSVVLSIVATALLLPKDIEDRTLYTILAKPVPRIDYLAGKLLGVLLLVLVSLVLMDLLMTGILQLRTNMVLSDQMAMAEARGWPPGDVATLKADILAQGPTYSLQGAVLSVFLRATIIASMALLISTFSSSTLFTTIISFLVYFCGHFQADARAIYLGSEAGMDAGWVSQAIALLVSLILPDFQLFNVIDAVIEGQVMPLVIFGKLAFVGLFYFGFYLIASWFVFAKKEF
jgi:ABC-type transport system involved in multi-copper enzyme maturation permease subunit